MHLTAKFLTTLCFVYSATINAAENFPTQVKDMFSLGVDVGQFYAPSVDEFRKILGSSKATTGVYLAYRSSGKFGAELGYAWSDRKPKTIQAYPGYTAFNKTATSNATHTVKVRVKDTYLDLFWHLRAANMWEYFSHTEFKLGMGLGFVREKFKFQDVPSVANDPLQIQLHAFEGRTNITIRLSAGVQTMFSETVGLRFLLRYQTLSAARARDTLNNVNNQTYRNAVGASLGIFWNFYGRDEPAPIFNN